MRRPVWATRSKSLRFLRFEIPRNTEMPGSAMAPLLRGLLHGAAGDGAGQGTADRRAFNLRIVDRGHAGGNDSQGLGGTDADAILRGMSEDGGVLRGGQLEGFGAKNGHSGLLRKRINASISRE